MKFNLNRIICICIVFVGVFIITSNLYAITKISARLDSVNLKMGEITELNIDIIQPKGLKGEIPLLSKFRQDGIIPVCGDSVELRAPSSIDTVVVGNNLKINLKVPLQAFDSGYYKLPEFIFVANGDSIHSNSVALKVYPVSAEANTPIHDYASVADPENPSMFDYIPDWLIDLWWLWILLIIIIFIFIYATKRYRTNGYIIPPKPEPSPYEVALTSLKLLKEKKLWEQGLEKDYFTELIDILRIYLYKRFGINAMEMTSHQIISCLKNNPELSDKRGYFRKILNMADFVKFAKVRPLPDDNVEAFNNALRFVEETKPIPVEEEIDSETSSSDKVQDDKLTLQKKGGGK